MELLYGHCFYIICPDHSCLRIALPFPGHRKMAGPTSKRQRSSRRHHLSRSRWGVQVLALEKLQCWRPLGKPVTFLSPHLQSFGIQNTCTGRLQHRSCSLPRLHQCPSQRHLDQTWTSKTHMVTDVRPPASISKKSAFKRLQKDASQCGLNQSSLDNFLV